MTKLLINEHPLMVLPTLAEKIGLNEAIILQQIHYWLDPRINKNFRKGVYWVYNTYQEWERQFPFWSIRTIRRIITSLENQGLIISNQLEQNCGSNTKWYTINYQALSKLEKNFSQDGQSGQGLWPNCPGVVAKMDRTIYKDAETTTEITQSLSQNTRVSAKDNKIYTDVSDGKEREMLDIWSKIIEEGSNKKQLTPARKSKLDSLLKRYFKNDLRQWKLFCERIKSSDFLMGKVTKFKASIDWVLKQDIAVKILEGDYGISENKIVSAENKKTNVIQEIDRSSESKEAKLIRRQLVKQVGKDAYHSWFRKVCIEFSEKVINFKFPTKFHHSHISENYFEMLSDLVETIYGSKVKINLFASV